MHTVPKVKPRSRKDIEDTTTRILSGVQPRRLSIPGPIDVLDLFEHLRDRYGLENCVSELPTQVEGITWPYGKVEISEAVYRLAALGDGRSRFTICHEFGHAVLHIPETSKCLIEAPTLYRRKDLRPFEDPEWQADTFASAILMPRSMVVKVLEGVEMARRLEVLQDTFQVSYTAANVRFEILAKDGCWK